jgi:uncharacterized protein (TIGR02646 family)
MKRVLKGAEPASLASFRSAEPSAAWEEMRNDALHNGKETYKDCRAKSIADQHGLCAYCECRIDSESHSRVEHFHPKSDTSTRHNWHLDWQNMLATCDGGESAASETEPLPDNLSCDAYKNHLANKGKLSGDMEQEMFNPLQLPAFPNLFKLNKGTGHLEVDTSVCALASVDADKLRRTVEILNLNCERLAKQRRKIVVNIDKNKKARRQKQCRPEEMPAFLIQRYFNGNWPEFFTTIRCCLGQAAEDHLRAIGYTG